MVVALAPVSDLVSGYDEGIGDGAIEEFLHDSPTSRPDVYFEASLLAHVPPLSEVVVVHGRDDARVPIAQTRTYVAASRATGQDVTVLEVPSLSHLDAIDPRAPHWRDVSAWIDGRRAP
ncbi:hypothetical protein CVS47_00315 [Microbacterium lemovicicum]|uniref:Peptidase S9 prolyl oligopeptidase catalytic domain-containing protein n=1 Tax=Microbacterium lemovicicum TaxID=1072463 RepID=A0A3Q9IW37_9MICO|nr:prolyl oligopeptidase family serine peptidase [Microbacterium lemovicicum]AZS35718.1 hypothetical protein CVS47_00315 [Microbacterium lemovicicum]